MTDQGRSAGDLHVGTVVVNVQDMRRALTFWCAVLGYAPREEQWDPQFRMLQDPDGRGVPVSLQLTDSAPDEPVRLHLDLYTADQAGQVARLMELGATRPDWNYPDDADFVVLRDTEGNEFCVIDHAELE